MAKPNLYQRLTRDIAENLYEVFQDNAGKDTNRKYYAGKQPRQLKIKPGKTDDNLIVNFVGLAIDRSVSHVLAGGVDFKYPEGADAQKEYLERVWEINRKLLLLYDAALYAAVNGTGYIKIKPDGLTDPYTGVPYPRLIPLNPEYLTIKTDPQDAQKVLVYTIEYKVDETGYKETTELQDDDTWLISNYQTDKRGKYELVGTPEVWDYDFPPILHWKNLPALNSVYGSSDIDDILGVQDKSNATVSNIQKQVRLQSHKQPWGRGLGAADPDIGPDKIVKLTGDNAQLGVLDFQTDITGSLEFSKDLRQTLFDVAREVDITSMADKLSALTNFGLRVLYSDTLSKTQTKRELFGEALIELNRRLLVLNGTTGEASNPGTIAWHDPLPVDVVDDMTADQLALSMGIVDKQTIAEKWQTRYGKSWEDISKNLQAAQASQQQNDVGTMLLRMRQFNMGQGNQQKG